MTFDVDLHVHSRYSGDTDADAEEMLERARERGLHGLAFTEHYSYEASEPVESLREKYAGSLIIFRGVEFSAAEGHCLIFGANTDRMMMKGASIRDLTRVVNEKGGVVIPSHPFRPGTSLGDLIFSVSGICALEGYNGCNMRSYNDRALDAASRLGLPFTGGSDAHLPAEVGQCVTSFERAVTEDNLIALLKAGAFQGADRRRSFLRRFLP
jgi:hypothetical protein